MALVLSGAAFVLGLFENLKQLVTGSGSNSNDFVSVDDKTVTV